MTAVKNPGSLIALADEMARQFVSGIPERLDTHFEGEESEPADHLYFLMHVGGMLAAKIVFTMVQFSHVYGITNLDETKAIELVKERMQEHLRAFKKGISLN